MQFQVPQFIDVENKIVGPLTLRQFLYLAGAGGISFTLFFILETWLWFLLTAFMAVLALAFAFIKYNGQPLPKMAWRALIFLWHPRMYFWQSEPLEKSIALPDIRTTKNLKEIVSGGMLNVKKLWQDILTSKNPIPKREKQLGRISSEQFEVFRKLTGQREAARRVDYR